MSDTPRTDKECGSDLNDSKGWPCAYVSTDFARTLEHENNQLREALKECGVALRQYGNREQWSKCVPDTFSGEVDIFDWNGDLADEPYEFAERVLSNPLVQAALKGPDANA